MSTRRLGDALALMLLIAAAARVGDADWVTAAQAATEVGAPERPVLGPAVVAALDAAASHAAQGRHERAVAVLDDALGAAHPTPRGCARMLLAAAASERALGEWPACVARLGAAIESDPDLIDPTSPDPDGEGATVVDLVRSAMHGIPERQRVAPSAELAEALRATYTLQRRLAGGCE